MSTKYKVIVNQDTLHRAKTKGCQSTDHRTGKARFDSTCKPIKYQKEGIHKGRLN